MILESWYLRYGEVVYLVCGTKPNICVGHNSKQTQHLRIRIGSDGGQTRQREHDQFCFRL